jgi:predicted Rossmann fold nucleotide-binding protein DprA/Smf involved in DNA uptake
MNGSGAEATTRDVREIVREEHVMRPAILAAVANEPRTVPEIAEAIGRPTREVVFWVMGMRKYGYLAEVPGADDEGYFRYRPVDRRAES